MKYLSPLPTDVAVDLAAKRMSMTSFPPLPTPVGASRSHMAQIRSGAMAPARGPAATTPLVDTQHGYRLRANKEAWVSEQVLARVRTPQSAAVRSLQASVFDRRDGRLALAYHNRPAPTPAQQRLQRLSPPASPTGSEDTEFRSSDSVPSTPTRSLSFRWFTGGKGPTASFDGASIVEFRSEDEYG